MMDRRDLKDSYKRLYSAITILVNEFDPCGLIEAGAPDDEYDCITRQIIDLLDKGTTVKQIREMILNEMQNHFGVDVPKTEPHFSHFFEDLNSFATTVRMLGYRNMFNEV